MRTLLLLAAFVCLLPACSSDGGGTEYRPEDNPDMVGPPGATLLLDDPESRCYGVCVEIAPGAVPEYRWIWLTDDYFNVPVTPWLPTGFWDKPRTWEGAFAIQTSGEAPYDLELKMTIPIDGIDTEPGEAICAFYHDEELDRWRIVMPQSIEGDTMTVVTTYRRTWNWGKIDVDAIDTEYVEAALLERLGGEGWNQLLETIGSVQTELAEEDAPYSCAGLRSLQSGLLESIRQSARADLLAYAPYIDGPCGECDPLSDQFREELEDFIENKLSIAIWELFADSSNNLVVELACRLHLLILDFENRSMACDYGCVHREVGTGFWFDYGMYHLAGGLQYIIEWAIWIGDLDC